MQWTFIGRRLWLNNMLQKHKAVHWKNNAYNQYIIIQNQNQWKNWNILCITVFRIKTEKKGHAGGRVVRVHAINAADPGWIPARGPLLHVTSPSLSHISYLSTA